MKVSIFGLGYVGCVSAGCLAKSGHFVIGVDISENKVELINKGIPTIAEEEIDELIKTAHGCKNLFATHDYLYAIKETDISIICVGTPNNINGLLNLEQIYKTAENIAQGIKEKDTFHTVVIRSTVSPGTNNKLVDIIENRSGKKHNIDFGVISNPEFLREGSAVKDYYNPPYTVFSSESQKAIEILKVLYEDIHAPIIVTELGVSEMIKYVNNSFHALKIAFANEIGNICKELKIDSHKLMELFVSDTKLNISSVYFKPGMAFGGSCLPKDLKGLANIAQERFINAPILKAIEESNDHHKKKTVDMVLRYGKKSIGVIGLAFKQGTDDLRNSPSLEMVEDLIGKGYKVGIYDPYVILGRLKGKNKDYVEDHLPHISELLIDDIKVLIDTSQLIIFNHNIPDLSINSGLLKNKIIIDNTGSLPKMECVYFERIC